MAAFDVTTRPTSLSLKPGSTGSIIVVVSNRLGRPVMGTVEGVMTPVSAGGWVLPPPDVQRPYPADPSATVTHEFKVAVPPDAPAQVAYFKAIARDVLAPDDTRSEGQSVAVTITPDAPLPVTKKKVPWWVWLILAVLVLAGAAVGIWLLFFKPDKQLVPSVLLTPPAEATRILKEAGFDSVFAMDTVGGELKDTNLVIRQEPEADSEMPKASEGQQRLAGIVISRPPGKVPIVVRKSQADATSILNAAGFSPVNPRDTIIRYKTRTGFLSTIGQIQIGNVAKQEPAAGTELPRGEMVGKTPATIWIRRAPTVPNVVGKSVTEAKAALTDAGFNPNITIKDTVDDNAIINTVVRQKPVAGSEAPSGTTMGKIAAGIIVNRAPVVVPTVRNTPKSGAKTTIENAGLKVGSLTARYTSTGGRNGLVHSSSPVGGTTVPRGSSVDLKIYVYHRFPSMCEANPQSCPKP